MIASIKYNCKQCGKSVTKTNDTFKDRERAQQWEEWAKENMTTCVSCFRKNKGLKEKEKLSKASEGLPTLQAISDKQLAYANSLRDKYMIDDENKARVERVKQRIAKYSEDIQYQQKVDQRLKELNISDMVLAVGDERFFKDLDFRVAGAVLTFTSAKEIIDVLKGYL